jgi:hypothetical protein
MQPNQSIIVYRNQTEANMDWFMQNNVYPFITDHWLGILIAIAVIAGGIALYGKLTNR